MHRRCLSFFAAPLSIAIASVAARAYDIHFDYTSFDNANTPGVTPHFGQAQFNVVNYASINGNYMMTSTDTHRAEMTANNNALAEFYNNFLADYNTQYNSTGGLNAAAEADAINAYTLKYSTKTGARPNWMILNEISASVWPDTTQKGTDYRQWVIDAVTRLHDYYGYDVVTYSPFANPGANDASWQALAAKSYIGVENYLSGAEVMAGGTDYNSRRAWAQAQYAWSQTAFGNRGVPASKLFLGEHFGNTVAGTGWGRSGLSASDWDTVIQIRQDAIRNCNYAGFLAYSWGSNGMLITETEQIQHEYWYRTRLVLPTQQPQWLSDAAFTIGDAATPVPLSWGQQLNWIGGVPDYDGAVATFFKTNTAARTITLDGSRTVGSLTFWSPNSYTIAPGTGGSLTLKGAGSTAVNVTVQQGSHTLAVPIVVNANVTFGLSGTLTLTAGMSNSAFPKTMTQVGSGTLNISGAQSYLAGSSFIANGGTTNFNSDAGGNLSLSAASATVNLNVSQTLATLTVNGGGKVNVPGSGNVINADNITVTGGQVDLSANAAIVRSGTLGSYSGGTYGGITGMIKTGRNGGQWNGNGIVTSQSAARGTAALMTLGVANASDALGISSAQTKLWHGRSVGASAVLVAYTYAGDANLDGKVNADDYFQINSNLNKPPSTFSYFRGDFNYDGLVNADDYFLIDSSFSAQATAPMGGSTPVPEPAALTILLPLACLRRRRAFRL